MGSERATKEKQKESMKALTLFYCNSCLSKLVCITGEDDSGLRSG